MSPAGQGVRMRVCVLMLAAPLAVSRSDAPGRHVTRDWVLQTCTQASRRTVEPHVRRVSR
jgi:hypothetical protein